ncbi:KaiC 1 [Niastella koreensis]|uniref:non-specific serine/threonine protein kinase n=2 Tax=Niastella koreensis TaxID=354356 RepID=G8TFS1_NIAKG|nr:circadian clock protein KaiC [Niastella koreensis]AEV99510.1 putative circadian clock protein, KaiC [Niastella koreensis GR20-10]OQP50102.1 KaiC 1 [Niastella koreensis]
MASKSKNNAAKQIEKSPSGISGFDEITSGGLPKGRPSLICGDAGAGKTLFGIEFIVKGAVQYGEPGVILTFEERSADLASNVASLGFDLKKLEKSNLLQIDYVHVERTEIEETGEYDLDGLFIRLAHAIDSIKAKRVLLDTIENLFGGLSNTAILRAELRRLFNWLKEKGVTAVITAERGKGSLTRQGLEEYVSDCVILLDHRVTNQISTRRLRVVKYRGSIHGTNEYPFLIDEDGISVLPVTSLQLNKEVGSQRISSGVDSLDNMLDGKGFYRGSSILVSGTAGTGKTSIAATFANAACLRKERCLFFAFEESPQQIVRNMRSIGLNLQQHIDAGLLQFHASRPTLHGLEMHLVTIHKKIKAFKPKVVILDPISNLTSTGLLTEVKSILVRLIDFLQTEGITVLFTALNVLSGANEQTDEGVSSLVDAWITVREIESGGERNKGLYIMKSRGMNHSNQIREFLITNKGIQLVDVYIGPEGVLTGSAREAQQLLEATGAELRTYAVGRKDREIDRKRKILEAKIASLQEEFASLQEELNKSYQEEDLRKEIMERNRASLSTKRTNKSLNGKRK